MKLFKIIFILFFILIFIVFIKIFAQKAKTSNAKYYEEPSYTQGTSNKVYVQEKPSGPIDHFIIGPEGEYPLALGGGNFYVEALHYPPGSNKPLAHDVRYEYYFKVGDATSNTVYSTQDNEVPKIIETSFVGIFNDSWSNTRTVEIKCQVQDSAGIEYIYLFQRIQGDDWPQKETDSKNNYDKNTSGQPKFLAATATFEIYNISEDNHYEFFIGAKDAAHKPESSAKEWKLGGNEKKPRQSDNPHLRINIDRTPPLSSILNLNPFQNTQTFTIPYTAHDLIINRDNSKIASGLNKVSLYYRREGIDTEFMRFNQPNRYNNTLEVIESGFIFNTNEQGYFSFYTQATDLATNGQADTTFNIFKTLIDIEPPLINNFIVLDTTEVSTEFITFADAAWTNGEWVEVSVDTSDNLSGVDSLIISGDIENEETKFNKSDPWLIKLKQGEGTKIISCEVLDKTKNQSSRLTFTIVLDRTPPVLTGLKLCDQNGDDYEITDDLTVLVKPEISDITDKTISHIALFESKYISPDIRDTFWQKYSPNETIYYQFKKGPAPRMLKLFAAIRDHAGNVSVIHTDSIEYVPRLRVKSLSLSDLDGLIINSKGQSFTDSLTIEATLNGISRWPGKRSDFKFATDCDFKNQCTIDYNLSDSVDFETRKIKLNLKKLGYDEKNDMKQICIRLISESISETTNCVCNSIVLDTIPPDFGSPGLSLHDSTENENVSKNIFCADSGWTNSINILAQLDGLLEDSSGWKCLFFNGDVESKEVDFKSSRISLKLLSQSHELQVVYVAGLDSAGNWGHLSKPPVLDTAYIKYEIKKPTIQVNLSKVYKKKTDVESRYQIPEVDTLFIPVVVEDEPKWENVSRIYICEKGEVPFLYPIKPPKHRTFTVPYRIKLGKGIRHFRVVLIDSAGNYGEDTFDIELISDYKFYEDKICNVPNPFNPNTDGKTDIVVIAEDDSPIQVKIYDIFGNLVISLQGKGNNGKLSKIPWDGLNGEGYAVAEGAYICIARIGEDKTLKTKIGVIRR